MSEKIHDLCEIEERLIDALKNQMAKGIESLDTKELGEVVDMIKDLAEAEKAHMEACYYEEVITRMGETEDLKYNKRMGYNHNRYSSGRYAPSGHGNFTRGYSTSQMPYIDSYLRDPEEFKRSMRMGYSEYGDGGNNNRGYNDNRYGKAYNDYQESRRYYTKNHDEASKREMDQHMNEHISDTVVTIKEMYMNAEPESRKKIKNDLSKLVRDLPV